MTPRQIAFVREYLASGNATRSMIAAGYSTRTASKHASRLLAHPEVAALVAKGREAQATALAVSATEELELIAAEANSEIRDAQAQLSGLRRRLRTATAAIRDLERLIDPAAHATRAPEPAPAAPVEKDGQYRPILPRKIPAGVPPRHWPDEPATAEVEYDPLET